MRSNHAAVVTEAGRQAGRRTHPCDTQPAGWQRRRRGPPQPLCPPPAVQASREGRQAAQAHVRARCNLLHRCSAGQTGSAGTRQSALQPAAQEPPARPKHAPPARHTPRLCMHAPYVCPATECHPRTLLLPHFKPSAHTHRKVPPQDALGQRRLKLLLHHALDGAGAKGGVVAASCQVLHSCRARAGAGVQKGKGWVGLGGRHAVGAQEQCTTTTTTLQTAASTAPACCACCAPHLSCAGPS